MATVTLGDISLSSPDQEAVYLLARIISDGDTTFRTRDGSGGGAWGMSIATYGGPPTDAQGQARVAIGRWREIRGGFAKDLPLDGTGRMAALLLVAWFCPAQYVTARTKTTVQEILGAGGLASWAPRVLATLPVMAALPVWSGKPETPPVATTDEKPTAPANSAPKTRRSGRPWWILLFVGTAVGVYYWARKRGQP